MDEQGSSQEEKRKQWKARQRKRRERLKTEKEEEQDLEQDEDIEQDEEKEKEKEKEEERDKDKEVTDESRVTFSRTKDNDSLVLSSSFLREYDLTDEELFYMNMVEKSIGKMETKTAIQILKNFQTYPEAASMEACNYYNVHKSNGDYDILTDEAILKKFINAVRNWDIEDETKNINDTMQLMASYTKENYYETNFIIEGG